MHFSANGKKVGIGVTARLRQTESLMKKRQSTLPQIGVVGLGLMGRGIATCLVANGYSVLGYDRSGPQAARAAGHVREALQKLVKRKLLSRKGGHAALKRFQAVPSFSRLSACSFVVEAVKEDLEQKRRLFQRLERILAPDAVIASNTSSLPATLLQTGTVHPERFIGMHWAEPAEITSYMEIIPGRETSPETIRRTRQVGERCKKEPAVLNFDIRGFISNRMMYAMIREACYLVEAGVADIETVDRSFRNDIGWWATLAGPFRWMDLTGIPAYAAVMEGLLPELSGAKKVPAVMRKMVERGAKGISNAKGFYPYSKAASKEWERAWVDFTYDIRDLADKYRRRLHLRSGE
jgi:3-hydroxybutyryl-CoA dehydrogenase